jgi:hypothetical protein
VTSIDLESGAAGSSIGAGDSPTDAITIAPNGERYVAGLVQPRHSARRQKRARGSHNRCSVQDGRKTRRGSDNHERAGRDPRPDRTRQDHDNDGKASRSGRSLNAGMSMVDERSGLHRRRTGVLRCD